MSAKPFISWDIERNGSDVALVNVVRVTDDGINFRREVLSSYETASRGATASARREAKKWQRAASSDASA